MSLRLYRALLFATATVFAVSGCKQSSAPSETASPAAPAPPQEVKQIGGEDVVKLERKPTSNGQKPEFLSAIIFPGRGMNVFQITANIPGKGMVNVLASPAVSDAAQKFTGTGDDAYGNASFSFGGAFLVPFPNRIRGKVSADGNTITTQWKGKTITVPANWKGKSPGAEPVAMHGLIVASKTDDVKTETTADGETVTGTIHAGDFGGHWLSKTDLDFTIALAGDTLDATITAKNVGGEEEPMAIGWHPYFNLPSGDRKQVRLHVPGEMVAAVNNYQDVFPTGKLLPVKGTKWDFTAPDGKPLDDIFLDDNWSKLKRTDGAVDVQIIDPAASYGIHVMGMSPEIKTVQAYSPLTQEFVAVEEQYNFGDPFGAEWKGMDTGMVTLKPGKSTTWHVRLKLFTPAK
jgi:galactose mutarotase-like enzyme